MAVSLGKRSRTIDGFFKSPDVKRTRNDGSSADQSGSCSNHKTYPFAIPHLPHEIIESLGFAPEAEGTAINDQPDLDLLYFQPYIPKTIQKSLFGFLRQELFFYRVQYKIKRGPIETQINTPRYTTVFGIDGTSAFTVDGAIIDNSTQKPVPIDRYKCAPRPLPQCLEYLKQLTEGSTGETYNFCLVNYYSNGNDSISYHSDDERFLGANPAIASFTLGTQRDFLLKHKPVPPKDGEEAPNSKPLKFPLAPGDMLLMRGRTQSHWLHSIPKRKGSNSDLGRINITFRKALVRGGTENYYQYNVGTGTPHKWDERKQLMMEWSKS